MKLKVKRKNFETKVPNIPMYISVFQQQSVTVLSPLGCSFELMCPHTAFGDCKPGTKCINRTHLQAIGSIKMGPI